MKIMEAETSSKSDIQFKVISLHNMKMTIKREKCTSHESEKMWTHTELNNNGATATGLWFDRAVRELRPQPVSVVMNGVNLPVCSIDLITLKSEPDCHWNQHVSRLNGQSSTDRLRSKSFSCDNQCVTGVQQRLVSDVAPETEVMHIKTERLTDDDKGGSTDRASRAAKSVSNTSRAAKSVSNTSRAAKSVSNTSRAAKSVSNTSRAAKSVPSETEADWEVDTSWIKTEPVWEFESEAHLDNRCDMASTSTLDSSAFDPACLLEIPTTEASFCDHLSGTDGGDRFSGELVKQEAVTDEEEEDPAENFVVEIDVAAEGFDGHEIFEDQQLLMSDKGIRDEEEEIDLPVQFRQPSSTMSSVKRSAHESTRQEQIEHVCGVCGMKFQTDQQCFQHVTTKHRTSGLRVCSHCQQVFTGSTELRQHMKLHKCCRRQCSRPTCDECGMSFPTVTSLRCHMRLHSENKAYKCPDCDKVFTHAYTLSLHQRLHAVKKDFTCDECGKSFHRPQYLKHHKRKHSGERPFVCNVCSKTFTNSSNLSAHLRTHTGEKPYKCSVCLATFTTSSALTVHKWRHTDAKPFSCEHCQRTFTTANTYKRHKVLHTGQRDFKCRECGKTFTQPSSLTIHMRQHTGERPFFCSQCGATFTQSAHLTVHVRTHTGERPFVCHICDKAYPRSEYLLRHKRRVHGLAAVKSKVNSRANQTLVS